MRIACWLLLGLLSCNTERQLQKAETRLAAAGRLAQVCAWLEAGLDVEAIDASLAQQIENQRFPKVVSLPLPWDVTTTTSTTTVVV